MFTGLWKHVPQLQKYYVLLFITKLFQPLYIELLMSNLVKIEVEMKLLVVFGLFDNSKDIIYYHLLLNYFKLQKTELKVKQK